LAGDDGIDVFGVHFMGFAVMNVLLDSNEVIAAEVDLKGCTDPDKNGDLPLFIWLYPILSFG
jgi:hypothetical protein